MSPEAVIEMVEKAFQLALMLSLPIMLTTLIVGVIISIFQSITSIQEQTMVFVPKMVAVLIALLVTFPWMVSSVMNFTTELFKDIPNLIR